MHPNVRGGQLWPRCTAERIQTEATCRLQGTHSERERDAWGQHISVFKYLKVLQLEFETFKEKELQLEQVVNCAKTWTFPMAEGYELKHDGKVEAWGWSGGP